MNIANLFRVDYWFVQPFVATGFSLWLLIGGFLVLVLAGLVCKIVSLYQEEKFKKVILKRSSHLAMTMGFLGLVWMFFRQEQAVFLSWRFWLLVWVGSFAWWTWSIVKYITKRVPEIRTEEERLARIEKYLPKNK
ncbi:MAG: hypothetical protein A2534_03635 [Candidatus Magasanikbacteria bacterium RIFOXYD2_FULL_39_9]|uniref:Uncharacterized protein n=1 Tax=Candidatus Magasanikbacteria bacterium RIFOXYD1_FULL_40_23 TaxID=1798705 RepID=A0A1F6P8S1_9BACT|nr:MAG: hypothetical protein A2563_05170 [Candidatus Magasanikbacteria bacterium RIFOXYD1_FULL_40_23]OGH93015.1 MAG: hypothetical protein A2534_03635 [Candidatus Magasanikbacteria bacterium RIFOXYD2_FULL_39_9]